MVQYHLEFTPQTGKCGQMFVNLAGEDVDPPEDDYVVGATQNPVMARQGTATGARTRHQSGQVPGAVADQWRPFLAQGGYHHLPHLSGCNRQQGLGIDDLQNIVIGPVVDGAVGRRVAAGETDAGTVEFREAGDVMHRLGTQGVADLGQHGIAGALRPQDNLAHGDLVPQPPLLHLFRQEESHGGGAADHRGLQIHQKTGLHLQVPRPHRYGHGAEPLASQLEADPGGPETVSHADLHPILNR